jgi:hypothetical protein
MGRGSMFFTVAFGLMVAAIPAASEVAVEPPDGPMTAEELSALTKDPLADIALVSFDNSFSFGAGKKDNESYESNVQPVYSLGLGETGWNLVTRGMLPLVSLPGEVGSPRFGGFDPEGGTSRKWGMGDLASQFFFVPPWGEDLRIGVGPILSWNTHTHKRFKGPGWGAGPTAVLVGGIGPFDFAILAANLWGYDGDFNVGILQPMIFWDIPGLEASYLSYNNTIAANWKEDGNDVMTVPVGLTAGKTFIPSESFGLDLNLGAYWFPVRPTAAAHWQLKFGVTLVPF